MPALSSFDYAIVRIMPRVERGEFINVGLILFCRTQRFLAARIVVALDQKRLAALAPNFQPVNVQASLNLISRICAGGAGGGPIGQMSQAERFHWLISPRSTVVQTSPVHCGLCTDPQVAFTELFERLVL